MHIKTSTHKMMTSLQASAVHFNSSSNVLKKDSEGVFEKCHIDACV